MKKLFFLLPFLFAFISCDLVTDKEYFVSVNPNHSFSWFNGSAVCYNFNCDVIQYYVENSVQLKKNGIACEIEFEWVTSSFVKIRPKEEWFNGALYLCELKGILYEKSGEEFSVNDAVAFYYGNAAESFCLTQAPFDEQRFDLNKAIVFKFNHKVYKTKFLECLSISTSTSYRVEANDDDTEFTIIPNESWRVNEIINWSFNDLISADNYILSGKNSGRIRCISDIEKPKVLTVCAVSSKDSDAFWDTGNPLNNNISGQMPIGLIFSKSMNLNSLRSGFSITPNISGTISCVSDDCTKFLFIPEENYAIATEYFLTIPSDVEDTLGIKISETYKEIFTSSETYLSITSLQFESEPALNFPGDTIPECMTVNMAEDLTGVKEMTVYIVFSKSIEYDRVLDVENLITLSLLFPLTSTSPVKTAVVWNKERDMISLTWKNMTASTDEIGSFYVLKIIGGKNGINTGTGNYLKENICVYLKLY